MISYVDQRVSAQMQVHKDDWKSVREVEEHLSSLVNNK
jgi:hypothetical protein